MFGPCLKRAFTIALPTMLIAGLLTGTTLSSNAALGAEFELKYGTVTAAGTKMYTDFLVPMARAIEAESGGRIAVDIRPQGGFGPQMELLKQVESGEIDIVNTLPGYYPGRFPRTSVMELPTMFENAEAGSRIGWTMFEDGSISADYKDFKMLGLFAGASYGIMTRNKDVTSLRDLRGMRIRVSSGVVGIPLADLGMIPLGLPSNLLAKAFTRNWLDAVNIGFEIAVTTPSTPPKMVIDEVSTLIDANLSASMQMLIMNKKRYESLPPDLRAVIDRHGGLEPSIQAGAMRDAADQEIKKKLATDPRYRFFAFSAADKAEIAHRLAPVLADWASGVTAQGIDGATLIARVRELGKEPNS